VKRLRDMYTDTDTDTHTQTPVLSIQLDYLRKYTGCSKKTDAQFYFRDNFGNSAPILTILLLLQAEIYGA